MIPKREKRSVWKWAWALCRVFFWNMVLRRTMIQRVSAMAALEVRGNDIVQGVCSLRVIWICDPIA